MVPSGNRVATPTWDGNPWQFLASEWSAGFTRLREWPSRTTDADPQPDTTITAAAAGNEAISLQKRVLKGREGAERKLAFQDLSHSLLENLDRLAYGLGF